MKTAACLTNSILKNIVYTSAAMLRLGPSMDRRRLEPTSCQVIDFAGLTFNTVHWE